MVFPLSELIIYKTRIMDIIKGKEFNFDYVA